MRNRVAAFTQARPFTVVLATALAYLLFVLLALGLHDGNPLWFAWLDDDFVSEAPAGSIGYDGQFFYAIARDGLEATPRLDNPPYRLQRILLPALAGVLALGDGARVAWTILLVNLLAIIATSALLSHWLERAGTSPWYSLIYTGYVGTLMAFSRDLSEPLTSMLAVAGVISWERGRVPLASALLALAALAKETALLYCAICALYALLRRDWRSLLWAAASALPALGWQALLLHRFGRIPLLAGPPMDALWPLAGVLRQLSLDPGRLSALIVVGVPALVLFLWGLWRLGRGGAPLVIWLITVHALAVLYMPSSVYDHIMHAGRNALGLVCSVVLAVPLLAPWQRRVALAWWVIPSLVWLIPILRWAPWP